MKERSSEHFAQGLFPRAGGRWSVRELALLLGQREDDEASRDEAPMERGFVICEDGGDIVPAFCHASCIASCHAFCHAFCHALCCPPSQLGVWIEARQAKLLDESLGVERDSTSDFPREGDVHSACERADAPLRAVHH